MIDTQAIRNRILQLALQGQLVEQDATDTPASELVMKLSEKITCKASCSHIKEEEIPYSVPQTWVWCRLSDIGTTNIGLTYHPEDTSTSGTIVARSSNIVNGKMDYSDLVRVTCPIRDNQYLGTNDILICARNGSKALVGKCAIFEGKPSTVAFGAFMAVFRTPLYRYVYYYFNTTVFKRNFAGDDSKQINQVTQKILKESLIPIPPLEEQQRIVDKIDQAFYVLDTIDELQAQYADNLTALKAKLIDAAIQGKLTEQLPEDGTAEELYQQIQAEKQALIKVGKIKKEKTKQGIVNNEEAFEIPENWRWVSVGDVCVNIQYGSSKKSAATGEIPVLRMGNIQNGKIVYDKLVYTSDPEEIEKYSLECNDLLFNRTNSMELVGKTAIYKGERPAIYAGYLVRITPLKMIPDYLNYAMQSRYYWNYCRDVRIDSNGQSNINAEKLKGFIFPLPPFEEQKRIITKLDEVLSEISMQ